VTASSKRWKARRGRQIATVPEEMLRPGKVEVGIVVRDLDAATAFYSDVLGLEYIGDLALPGGTMKRFMHGDAVVKLLRFDETPQLANPPSGPLGGATGLRSHDSSRPSGRQRRTLPCRGARGPDADL